MELAEIRRRLRGVIESAKRQAAERRVQVDAATRGYEHFLAQIAIPAFHQIVQALNGEGYRFRVSTPGQSVRLASDFSADDYIELALDADRDSPAIVVRASRGRGRRNVSTEHVVFAQQPIDAVTEDDVMLALLDELPPFVER
jgi:hypothetical protein